MPAPLPSPRIAVPDAANLRFFGDDAQAASIAETCAALVDAGATLIEVDFTPFHAVAQMLYDGAWVAERYTVIEDLLARDPDAVHPVIRTAEAISAADAFRDIYRLAGLKRACAPVLAGCDMLCVPTIPTFYTLADLVADPITPNSNLGTYTNFVNLLDLAALAVPAAPRRDGRPGSVTLIGPAGGDGRLAAEALRIEALANGMPAPDPVAQPAADEKMLAVCGAHMSGLALNGQLTGLGGRFLRAAYTAPECRLYALPGGPPERPGLVRRAGRQAIALELWALPKQAAGDLLAMIPAPLGLGRIKLDDGGTPTGFLCEAAGIEGARDITEFGGWRGYIAAA